jgi:hypothetical protein
MRGGTECLAPLDKAVIRGQIDPEIFQRFRELHHHSAE